MTWLIKKKMQFYPYKKRVTCSCTLFTRVMDQKSWRLEWRLEKSTMTLPKWKMLRWQIAQSCLYVYLICRVFLQHTLETALLSASQEIEMGSDNPAAMQSVIQQRDLLQSGLLSTCRELSRVTAVSHTVHSSTLHTLMLDTAALFL